jgi:BlaI family transcriptional regulator, penicillinase repressor
MDSKAMTEITTEMGDLEREVMELVWTSGAMTAENVREGLDRPLKESTVRTVLKRLEDKGLVRHSVLGRTYLFEAVESRGQVAARAVRRIVDWICNGSVEEVLVGMVDTAVLDSTELQQLAAKIAKAKKRRG